MSRSWQVLLDRQDLPGRVPGHRAREAANLAVSRDDGVARALLCPSCMQLARSVRSRASTRTDANLERLSRHVATADDEGREQVRDALVRQIRIEVAEVAQAFDADVRTLAMIDVVALVRRVRDGMLPLVRRAQNAARWLAKPRGLAADFGTVARIYDDEPRGKTGVDRVLDRSMLDLPAISAIRNRCAFMRNELRATVRACGDRGPARVTSIGAGPARELFEVYHLIDDVRALEATLVDFDPEALAYCGALQTAATLDDQITLVEADIIGVAAGRAGLVLEDQHLVYCINLVEYLRDDLVVGLLDWMYGTLAPNGRVILGSFHPSNPTRAIMDHLLDWKLLHRDEMHLNELARRSKFGRDCARIRFEGQRIDQFVELTT